MGHSLAGVEEDQVSIYVESHSANVLQLLHFFHTGCVFSRTPIDAKLSDLFGLFGIDIRYLLKNSEAVQSCPPALKHFLNTVKPVKSEYAEEATAPFSSDMVLTKIEELKDSADARIKCLKRQFKGEEMNDFGHNADDANFDSWPVEASTTTFSLFW